MYFKCKNCGGNTVYNPDQKAMLCPYCGSIDSQELIKAESLLNCPSCGGPIEEKGFSTTKKCEYCGNYILFDDKMEGNYEPHLIIPFRFSKEAVKTILQKNFSKKKFLPASFLSEQMLESMVGSYVPFWLYDYNVNYEYEGRGTKIRIWTVGDIQFTETSIFSLHRNMDVAFDKIPVDASNEMNDEIMDLMEPYRYEELESFQPKYLSGFWGEVYNQEADALKERGINKVRQDTESLMRKTVNGYGTITTVNQNMNIQSEKNYYALMPVWQYRYLYRDKPYVFHINGQTGKIIGNTPIAVKKVILYGVTMFASLTAMLYLIYNILEVL